MSINIDKKNINLSYPNSVSTSNAIIKSKFVQLILVFFLLSKLSLLLWSDNLLGVLPWKTIVKEKNIFFIKVLYHASILFLEVKFCYECYLIRSRLVMITSARDGPSYTNNRTVALQSQLVTNQTLQVGLVYIRALRIWIHAFQTSFLNSIKKLQ